MIDSLTALLTGLVDYAGLFPPAALDMASAVRAYSEYLAHPSRFMLGRFVVPVARLPEFDQLAQSLFPRGDASHIPDPWRLSALTGPDINADIQEALKFNCRHWSGSEIGHAVIDTLEIKVSSAAEIGAAMSRMPKQFQPFFEVPADSDPDALIREIKRTGGAAKIRTGGVTQSAFPNAIHVARFLERCLEHDVAFKATAGLHHPIRGEYRLTYDANAPMGTMYGYLNVFLAAAFALPGASEPFLIDILEETDANAFRFTETGVRYRGQTLPTSSLEQMRDRFARSFGSCSFLEPVDDLATLHLT